MTFKKGNQLYKLRRSFKGENNPFYRKHHTKESKEKMGVKKGTIPWNKNKNNIYSKKTLQKMRDAKKDYIPWNKDENIFTDERIKKYIRYGEKSNWYIHGNAYEPYGSEFNNSFKKQIRTRDNYICQICNTKENGKHLDVHHIDYNKKNNKPDNLISLCHPCHGKTNTNRNKWKNLLQQIILKKIE